MSGVNITNAGLMFTRYIRAVDETLNHKSLARSLCKPSEETGDGSHLEWVVHVRRSGAINYSQDGGDFPTAGNQKYVRGKAYRKFLHAKVKLTKGAMAAAKGGKGSVRSSVDSEVKGMMRDILKLENGTFFRDGTGQLTKIDDSSITGTDTSLRVQDARMLWEGVQVDVYDATNGAFLGGATELDYTTTPTKHKTLTVSSVDETPNSDGTFTVNFEEQVGSDLATGDFIVWKDSYGNAPLGLDALVDDATVTFQNVNVSTYPRYKSLVLGNSGTDRDLTPNLLRRMMAGLYQKSGNDRPGDGLKVICSSFQAINLEELYEGELRTTPDTKVAGQTITSFQSALGKFGILTDSDALYKKMFFVDPGKIYRWTQQKLDWRRDPGSGAIFKRSDDANFYTATVDEICEYYIRERHTSGKIEDLREDPSTAY